MSPSLTNTVPASRSMSPSLANTVPASRSMTLAPLYCPALQDHCYLLLDHLLPSGIPPPLLPSASRHSAAILLYLRRNVNSPGYVLTSMLTLSRSMPPDSCAKSKSATCATLSGTRLRTTTKSVSPTCAARSLHEQPNRFLHHQSE